MRSVLIEDYLDRLESAIDHSPLLLHDPDYREVVALVAAPLIPGESLSRDLALQCWGHFYDVRRSLEMGNGRLAGSHAKQWQSCLKYLQPDLVKQSKRFLPCLR